MNEYPDCLNDTLDGELTNISRSPHVETVVKCGETACGITCTYIGLGENRLPVLAEMSDKCLITRIATSS